MRAPGKIPAGKICDSVTATIDLMPTLAKLAGGNAPSDRIIDGVDISNLVHGQKTNLQRDYFYYQHDCLRAVRSGKWKLMLAHTEPVKGSIIARWKRHVAAADTERIQEPQLYNVETDISESINVASQNPRVVTRLKKLATSAQNEIGDHDRFGTGARTFGAPSRPLSKTKKPTQTKTGLEPAKLK